MPKVILSETKPNSFIINKLKLFIMKKTRFFIATLLVVAAASVAVVSCKKENSDTLLNNTSPQVKTFAPPQVDDMNAYLKGFKQKMQNVTREGDETLSLEEAAWHLSSMANYDFANANVDYTDLRYDTLLYQVNVTNEQVSLLDLNTVYASIASDIDAFYHNLDLLEKHFRFIGASISENGQVVITLITSYRNLDHTWYFSDDFEATNYCYEFFDELTYYTWNTTALEQLEYAINILEGREYAVNEYPSVRVYYVYTQDVEFNYDQYFDSYGSPFLRNSRIFATEADTWATPYLDINDMCYCLDSYLQLPFMYAMQHSDMINQRPVRWRISGMHYDNRELETWDVFCHIITVTFGRFITTESPIQY